MTRTELIDTIFEKKSYLCVGLDSDLEKIPEHLRNNDDPVFEFNKAIIDATRDLCVAYKLNTAFYEANGAKGWTTLQKTAEYIGQQHFVIADAKRGDIGNTCDQYAKAFFQQMNFDAITVAPYMGEDSVKPFLQYQNRWAIVLGLTSNEGAKDFELQPAGNELLYEKVIRQVATWGNTDNLMFVIGATRADQFVTIRQHTPNHFYLVPGVGAQGGSLTDISEKAMNKDAGLLINVSRAIIYASSDQDYGAAARHVASSYQQQMAPYIEKLLQERS